MVKIVEMTKGKEVTIDTTYPDEPLWIIVEDDREDGKAYPVYPSEVGEIYEACKRFLKIK